MPKLGYESVTLRSDEVTELLELAPTLGVDKKAPAVIRALIRKFKEDQPHD